MVARGDRQRYNGSSQQQRGATNMNEELVKNINKINRLHKTIKRCRLQTSVVYYRDEIRKLKQEQDAIILETLNN